MNSKSTRKSASFRSESDNALTVYLKEINRISLLTREEEEDLARKAAAGDTRAKNRLLEANLRFVVNVAKKYQNQGLPLDDLISEGNIGLINAIERFDVDKGYHFISYAVCWIRQAILKAICEKSRTIRLPLNRANELVQIEKARKELYAIKGEEPSDEEISSAIGIDVQVVKDIVAISREMISLETPVYQERDSVNLGDTLVGKQEYTPDSVVLDLSLKNDINRALQYLSDKESEIIQHRFGLNQKKPMSLKEIGSRYNLTKERIRQIERKALERLSQPAESLELSAYVSA